MYLETYEKYNWFHTDVKKWTAEIKKQYLEDLNSLQQELSPFIVSLIREDNTKLVKFAKSINFKYETTIKGLDNMNHHIYSRSL
jgi:uncharacterized protein YeaO (DUF488 family)